jgi:hypothetical protein
MSGGSIRIIEMPDLGTVTDATSFVGERAGSGRFSATALRDYVSVGSSGTGVANVRDYGALGDGAADDSTAIQAAVATGMPVFMPAGNYRITSQINCSTRGQAIRGAGRQATFIRISGPSAGFSAGIFNVTNSTAGTDACQYFSDFTVALAQPNTAVRASLNSYPPVFYLNAASRCQFENVRLAGGIDGIYMAGNCGGFRAFACDFACYGRNIYIDGNLDVTSFTDCEVWPFSDTGIMTANQQKIFYDANCYGILSLRNDYLDWKGGLFLVGRAAVFQNQPSGSWPGWTYGSIVGCGFDTFGGLEVAAGNILTDNCTFSVGGDPTQAKNAVRHTGGVVTVRGAKFFTGSTGIANNSLVYSNVASGAAGLIVSDCSFETGLIDVRAIYCASANDYFSVAIVGNQLNRVASGTYTTSMIELAGGNGAVTNNIAWNATGTVTSVPWLGIDANSGPYMVRGNMANGWATTVVSNIIPSASLITLPAVIGDAMPEVIISGNTTIGSMTYSKNIGTNAAYGGLTVTLFFQATITITSGTAGTAGQFLLNGRTNFIANVNSSLTVQLTTSGNWQEIGRCL